MDADRTQVLICEEGSFGTTPSATLSAATIAAVESGNLLTDSGNGFVTAGFKKGMKVNIAGFTGTAANNGNAIVISVADGSMPIRGLTLTDDAAGETVILSTPVMDEIRFTSESLASETDITVSNEIRDDRQKSDIIRTGRRASGDVGFEFSAEQFDELLSAGLMDDLWSDEVTKTATTLAAVASGNQITDSGNGLAVFTAYEWIKIEGFTGDTANNGYAKIVSVAAGAIVIEGLTLADDTAGESVTITQLSSITNGTTKRSFSIERQSEDETTLFTILTGMYINQMSLSIAVSEIVTGSFSFMGKNESSAVATAAFATAASSTNQVFNGVDHVDKFLDDMTSTDIISMSLSVNNNYREQAILGSLGPNSMGAGSVEVTGSFVKYFTSSTQLAKYLAFTTTRLAMVLVDDNGNVYIVDMPEVKLTSNRHSAGGINTNIQEEIDFQAVADPTEQVTIRISRLIA